MRVHAFLCIASFAFVRMFTADGYAQIPNPLNAGPVLLQSFNCPNPQPQMSGTPLVGALPVSSDDPNDPIRSLAIRISTSGDPLSGTNDDVWLDIGPKAWKIGDDFDKGSTKTIVVNLGLKDDSIDVPDIVPLYVRDISQVRLEKKGLCGLTDAPDSIAGSILPGFPTPAATIDALKQQVKLASYALDQQQSLLDVQNKLLTQQVQIIADAQQVITSSANEIATIPGQISNVHNQLLDVQKQIVQTPGKIASQSCSNVSKPVRVILGVLTGGGSELVCQTVQIVNPVFQSLTNTATSLAQSQNSLSAELQAATVRKSAAVQSLATTTAAKAAVELEKKKDELQYAAAHRALDSAQNALADAEALAAKLPLPNISLPPPGQWKVGHITLFVNGHDFANFEVGDTLKQRHAEWSSPIKPISRSEQFVRGMRVNINSQSKHSDEESARVTTIFKLSDISGWKAGPVASARAIGVLRHPPSPGGDGFVSLDLEVEEIETGNEAFILDDQNGIGHKRFIRVEYKNRAGNGIVDDRYKGWSVGQRLVVDAPIAWDTDRQGFYELHPDNPGQIAPLGPSDSGRTPGIVLWWRRLTH